jgi:hypothetical protein
MDQLLQLIETPPTPPRYALTEMGSSYCPDCEKAVMLLSCDSNPDLPSFFTCLCGYIGQVGVGTVRSGPSVDKYKPLFLFESDYPSPPETP